MKKTKVVIRPMAQSDISVIAVDRCPPWSTIDVAQKKWSKYFKEQQENLRTVGIVEHGKDLLGYGSLLFKSEYSNFLGIPEIQDIRIYNEYQGQGHGSRLIKWLEKLARNKGYKKIGIGVGLYADYGNAQKLYCRLGYTLDGYGVTYRFKPTIPGESYPLDDDLILWMTKDL